ncbi:hypothetical protein [Brumimicrobium mesophilum]|nr:hypothetical protein [Brumimicrobium mesophilum]
MNASLIYYMGIDPDSLSDEEWACKVQELTFIRKQENKGGGN